MEVGRHVDDSAAGGALAQRCVIQVSKYGNVLSQIRHMEKREVDVPTLEKLHIFQPRNDFMEALQKGQRLAQDAGGAKLFPRAEY